MGEVFTFILIVLLLETVCLRKYVYVCFLVYKFVLYSDNVLFSLTTRWC